jgi:hypothetical protein
MEHPQRFSLTSKHLALLRGLVVEWDDSPGPGSPMFSPGCPYRTSDTLATVVALAGLPDGEAVRVRRPDGGLSHVAMNYPPGTVRRAHQLHQETGTALAVVLAVGSFTPGTYKQAGNTWQLVG